MTVERLLASLDFERVAKDHALDSTLMPTLAPRFRRRPGSRPPEPEKRSLPPPPSADRTSHELKVKGPLAEGGMGTISLAEQSALRRDVALKTLKDEFLEPTFADRMRREARILGLVEHPNIVPLYALDTDERNAPRMVMKRIEGVSWRELIRDPKHPAIPGGQRDRLAWHLGVLRKVCDAVHYAHSKGVLHLDLKPANVMIGAFREVYLVDWGVAVCTDDTQRGWLPMADEVNEVLGTPAYLAPEMVDVASKRLGPRSDVFLLGATLYEVLTGKPPHEGESLQELLAAAYLAEEPELPESVPAELQAIVKKAMATDPEDRHESPEALRAELSDFLEHRTSISLAGQASAELAQLRAFIELETEEPSETGTRIPEVSDDRNARVQRLFGRVRFGFAEARRQWPDNPIAREGQRAALLLMGRYHVHRGEAASAEGLMESLAPSDGEAEAIRKEAKRQRREAARIERLGLDETDTGGRARGKIVMGAALLVTLPTLATWVAGQLELYEFAWWHIFAYDVLLAGFLGLGAVLSRRTLRSRRSRRMTMSILVLALLSVGMRLTAMALGVGGVRSAALELVFFGSGCTLASVMSDRRFFLAAPGLFVGAALVLLVPGHAHLWIALSGLAGPLPLAWAWLRAPERESPEELSRRRRC